MTCWSVSGRLSALIDGELSGMERESVRRHLEACECCRSEYEALLNVRSLLVQAPAVMPDEDFEERLVASVMNKVRSEKEPAQPTWRLAVATAVTVSVLVLGALQLITREDRNVSVAQQPRPNFSIRQDQALMAGSDPIGGASPITSATWSGDR